VALYHYPSTSFLFFRNGYQGVYFFFILSGFIISLNYSHKIITFKDLINFQIKRFYRLYPLHFVTLFLVLFIQIVKYFLIKYSSLEQGLNNLADWYSLKNFVGNLFLLHSIFKDFYIFSWNGVSWSISAEFYTYIIFGFLFLIFKKYKFLAIVIFTYIILNIDYFSSIEIFNDQFFLCIYNFSLGYFGYCLYARIKFRLNNFIGIFFVILLLVVKIYYENIFYQYKEFFFLLIILCAALLKNNTIIYKFLNLKSLVFLGTISYSFYLIHQIAIYLFIQFCKFIIKINFIKDINGNVSNTGNGYYDTLIHLAYISLSIFLAYFLHKYIELKYRKK
jgi:peptidoglycan/LPS O-acetylase OafA/YrhL